MTPATASRPAPRRRGVLARAARLARVRVGIALVALVGAVALIGPFVAPHGTTDYVARPHTAPAAGAVFGTDYLGQDVWTRFLHGGRPVVVIASLAAALGVLAGALVGISAAWGRGRMSAVVMRGVDVALAVPPILLALVAIAAAEATPWLVVGVVTVVTAPRVARVAHGAAAVVVEQDFVELSASIGESRRSIVVREVLPNVSGPLLVESAIRLTYAVALVSSLAFLGLTTGVNAANWGLMVQENRGAFTVQPWGVLLPAAGIVAFTLGVGLVADGLARTHSSWGRP